MKDVVVTFISLLLFSTSAFSQTETEFKKGFVMHARWQSGLQTNFHQSDIFTTAVAIVPQLTIVEHVLHAGIVAGVFYNNQKLQLLTGATVSVRLATINAGIFGSAANLHASVEQLWGSGHQRLTGVGIHADLLNKIIVGLTAHRDMHLNNWWLQQSIAIRINRNKKISEPFNE